MVLKAVPIYASGQSDDLWQSGSAVGQAEQGEAIRQSDHLCARLCHKRLHCKTARRTGDKIGGVIEKVDGEPTFANKLAFIRRAPIATDEDKIGIRFTDGNLSRRHHTSSDKKHCW